MKQTITKKAKTHLAMLLCIAFGFGLSAQTNVTGVISDESSGEALIGASIFLKGTETGTISDIDGSFSIQASPTDILVASFIGYNDIEQLVGNQTVINFNLSIGEILDEVVVTGYTSQSKRNISGAVTSISADELSRAPVASVAAQLQGKAAGVNITQSGAPGSGVSVRIRGFGTIGNNEPLYIVDGIPLQGATTLLDINPADVESVQILKDASAASIYGARAANGVIIVTTKKGSITGAPKVSFDAYYGIENIGSTPPMLSSQELGDVIFEQQRNAGITPSHPQYGNGATAVIPEYIFPAGATAGDPRVDPANYDQRTNPITRTAPGEGTDWWDVGWNPASVQSYNLGVTGGNEAAQYALGTGYYKQEGVLLHSAYERFNIRANSLFRLKDRIRIGQTLNVSYSRKQAPDNSDGEQNVNGLIASFYKAVPLIPLFDEGGNFGGGKGAGVGAEGVLGELERNQNDYQNRARIIGNFYAEADITNDITIKSSINGDYNNAFNKNWTGINFEAAEPRSAASLNSRMDIGWTWTWYNTLNYRHTFASDHNVGLLLGTEAIKSQSDFVGANRIGFFSETLDYRQIDAGNPTGQLASGNTGQRTLFSLFAKADYDYKGKYIISGTIRRDGSSVFGEANRYGIFPAVSVGWRLSDEPFMDDVAGISDFKLRAGWGQTGNQEIGFRVFSTFASQPEFGSYDIAGSNGAEQTGFDTNVFGNPEVKWETTTSLNIGFDAGFLNNRLNVSFDWFSNDTEDMLTEVPPSSLAGVASNPFINIGEVNNTGFDFELSYSNEAGRDFTYDIGLNLSHYNNEVTKLATDAQEIIGGEFRSFEATITRPGDAISSYYGLEIDGIFQTQAEVDAHAEQGGKAVGRWRFSDINGDGVINDNDRTILGTPHPDLIYGLTTNFGYKNWDLSLFLQGVQGNEVFNTNNLFADLFQFQGNRRRKVIEESWGYPGVDNATAELPQINQNAPVIEKDANSYYVEDGSFMRIKNLTLGYTLPNQVVNRWGLDRLRVYVAGNNLLTVSSYGGLDPEINVADPNGNGQNQDIAIGLDKGNYPVTRSITFGVNVTF